MRDIVILGSTGSIGTQALEVVGQHPARFRVVGLAAGGGDVATLARQVLRHRPAVVGVARASSVQDLQLALYAEAKRLGWNAGETSLPRILAGPTAASEVAGLDVDLVLNGITGSAGLVPTITALATGATLALANKESLVIGGRLVTDAAADGQLVAVDSEHSAIAQCLRAGRVDEVDRLVLTASGGPFRGRTAEQLRTVTPEEAMQHPTWDMGRVVTTNSATLVNKGLELLEAHLFYGTPLERIDVVVHPQSVVHSMVQFVDGSTIAQCSPPDMKLPIALALGWPDRLAGAAQPCDWSRATSWTFEPLDEAVFPAVRLARLAGAATPTAPAVYNAANEVCVDAFLVGRIGFTDITDVIAEVLDRWLAEDTTDPDPALASGDDDPAVAVGQSVGEDRGPGEGVEPRGDAVPFTVDGVLQADAWARTAAASACAVRAGASE